MSSPDREPDRGRRLLLLAPLALAACGFAPAYAPDGPGTALRDRVAVATPDTPDGYRLRARLEDRLGRAPTPVATLTVTPEVERDSAAVTPAGAITRYNLLGRAPWRLTAGPATLAEGEATAFTGYSATGPLVAGRAAESDARERLMILLADEIATRLLLLPPGTLP
ncbi:LPS assembly lipoprotein LptE [Rubellimicrobium aerolatum]|uniref:LPS assembly lipoprotein LptE n=1 Tax=Rubellimicrobium aerolatum TaxID=490979 RepID=A0ABW0SAK6_9RHOB|nr:LPS assembly lipoprotein LptE [Rubellimicrobium aerolatum]MBP1805290.1 LPS-assembly lipoprotein [Rubellimicrobium aerolatum]